MNHLVSHNTIHFGRRLLLAMILVLGLTSCQNLENLLPRYSDNRIKRVHLVANLDVNQSTPVAVDIVFLFEEALVAQLSNYTARKWFDEKLQFQLQYPNKFVVFNYELIPVSQATLVPANEKSAFPAAFQKAYKVMAFANYLNESDEYTIDVTPFKYPTLELGKNKITIKEKG